MLWSLVSKEAPAPMEGPRSVDHDQGQKLRLTIRWDIPNVLVKDVPDFELLAPELEAGTDLSPTTCLPECSQLPSLY